MAGIRTDSNIVWTWSPAVDAVSVVGYRIRLNGVSQDDTVVPLLTSFGLPAGGYVLEVKAVSPSGAVSVNWAASSTVTVPSSQPGADVTAPAVPAPEINYTLDDAVPPVISIQWDAVDDIDPANGTVVSGVSGYRVWRNGEVVATVAQPAAATGLGPITVGPNTLTVSDNGSTLSCGGNVLTKVWGTADSFFLSDPKAVSGPGSVRIRINSLSNSTGHEYPKIMLMLRQTMDADSPFFTVQVRPANLSVNYRSGFAVSASSHASAAYSGFPVWLDIAWDADWNCQASFSTDGTAFTAIGAARQMAFPAVVYAAKAASSEGFVNANSGTISAGYAEYAISTPSVVSYTGYGAEGSETTFEVDAFDNSGNYSAKSAAIDYNPTPAEDFPTSRNAIEWPFAADSPWNIPVGDGAEYSALIGYHDDFHAGNGYWRDEDVIIATPSAPTRPLHKNISMSQWNTEADWCPSIGTVLVASVPVPDAFVVNQGVQAGQVKENSCGVILLADGDTLTNIICTARCAAGGPLTAGTLTNSFGSYTSPSIRGEGRIGGHGGSWLSALGGTIRCADVERGVIRHALRASVSESWFWPGNNGHSPKATVTTYDDYYAYIWPAFCADSNSATAYKGLNRYVKMGSLLAIPYTVDLDTLGFETEPAMMIALALQRYGMYLADKTGMSAGNRGTMLLGWEIRPHPTTGARQKAVEVFEDKYGFSPIQSGWDGDGSSSGLRSRPGNAGAWVRDMDRCLQHLAVVLNNGPDSRGGGGTPLQPLAPDFA